MNIDATSKWLLSCVGFCYILKIYDSWPCYASKMKGKDNSSHSLKIKVSDDSSFKGGYGRDLLQTFGPTYPLTRIPRTKFSLNTLVCYKPPRPGHKGRLRMLCLSSVQVWHILFSCVCRVCPAKTGKSFVVRLAKLGKRLELCESPVSHPRLVDLSDILDALRYPKNSRVYIYLFL